MLLKAKINPLIYKKMMLICFLLITFVCVTGNLVLEKFLYKKEIEKNLKLAKTITNSILNIESQLEKTVINAIQIIENELLKNLKLEHEKMLKLKEKAGVDSIFIYDTNGKAYFSTTGSLDSKKFQDYYENVPTLFERDGYYEIIKSLDRKLVILPIFIIPKGGNIAFKQAMLWNAKLDYFIEIKISNENIRTLLEDNIKIHDEINAFRIWTPSGNLLIATDEITNENIKIQTNPIETYIKKPTLNDMKIIFSFGNNIVSKRLASYGLNYKNDNYFYTAEFDFDKKSLAKELLASKTIFITFFLLLIFASFLTMKTFYDRKQFHESLKLQAQQIHHDIATPIQTLDFAISNMSKTKEYQENRNIRMQTCVSYIKGIINDLYYLHDNEFNLKIAKSCPELLYPIINSVVNSADNKKYNKNIIFKTKDSAFILINIDNILLRRALHNLVKNATEATKDNVEIKLAQDQNNAIIKIKDNGTGMTKENIERLMSGSIKSEKLNGRGLGFKYAKKIIEHFGGSITIESQVSKGTTQIITLPIAKQQPNWFINKINTKNYNQIIILDDDEGMFDIYKQIFGQNIICISNTKDITNYINNKNNLFIIDYQLNDTNGLKIIEKYNLKDNAILSTNMYLEGKIKDQCDQLGIKLLPKELIEFL